MFMVSLNELSTKVDTMQYDNLQSTIETNKQIDSLIARLITVTEGKQILKVQRLSYFLRFDWKNQQCIKRLYILQFDVWLRVQWAKTKNEKGWTAAWFIRRRYRYNDKQRSISLFIYSLCNSHWPLTQVSIEVCSLLNSSNPWSRVLSTWLTTRLTEQ